jgi:tetratricopeptide (TPR) repeat protein
MRGIWAPLFIAALAIVACAKSGNRPNSEAMSHLEAAESQLAAGQLDAAIQSYDKIIAADPGFESAYFVRGQLWRAKGDLDRAIADFTQAIAGGMAQSALPYTTRGEALAASGRYPEAIADYDLALERRPGFAAALAGRGATRVAMAQDEAALPDLDRALVSPPGMVKETISVTSTTVASRIGPPGRSTETITLNYSTRFLVALGHAARGEIRVRRGHYDDALADLDAAIEMEGNLDTAYVYRALANLGLGLCTEGRTALRLATARVGVAAMEPHRPFIKQSRCPNVALCEPGAPGCSW